MEYAVQSNVIRNLTKEQHQILTKFCQYSNNFNSQSNKNLRKEAKDNG